MLHSLLSTKLNVPPARQSLVPRPRLLQQLNQGMDGKLILISAPAGFGKTTLLAEWAAQSPIPVAWVSLDEGDNDLERFLSYLTSALEIVHPDIGLGQLRLAIRQSSQKLPLKSLLTTLVNDVAESQRPMAIVLDDYHLISAGEVHDALAFLIGYLPSSARLVVASRTDLPLPMARLRARHLLTELRAGELRFTTKEASTFLQDTMGLTLSADEIANLDSRTEGWITGLQLAALSLRSHDRPGEFIAGVGGTHRFILDYLAEEVLAGQPPEVQSFLLRTSILKRLTGSLCNAVMGMKGAHELLAQLETQSLFVIALDEQRQWYRYHHLFGEFLQAQLLSQQPDMVTELHRRAINWYRAEGVISEAIEHALIIGDYDQAAELIEDEGRRLLVEGEISTIARWSEFLPSEVIQRRPRLELTLAWTQLMRDPVTFWQQSQSRVVAIEADLSGKQGNVLDALSNCSPGSLRQVQLAELAMLKAFLVRGSGDLRQTIRLFEGAIDNLPKEEPFLRGFAMAGLGSVFLRMGDVRRAEQCFATAELESRVAKSDFGLVITITLQAAMQAEQANFAKATRTYERAITVLDGLGTRAVPMAGQALTGLGDALREQNRIAEASEYVAEGIALGHKTADIDALREGYVIQARLLLDQGQTEAAQQAIRAAMQEARISQSVECQRVVQAWQARLDYSAGRMATLRNWAAESGVQLGGPVAGHASPLQTLTYARYLLTQRRYDEAIPLLEGLAEAAESDGRLRTMIEALALVALCYQATGGEEKAIQSISRAMLAAEAGGAVRVFVDLGPPMAALLREAGARGHTPEYVQRLLAAYGDETQGLASFEPLSTRELEVLGLLAAGMSNPQIASELVIALSTVKTHVNRIYAKLDARNRAQAIVKAREAGLID